MIVIIFIASTIFLANILLQIIIYKENKESKKIIEDYLKLRDEWWKTPTIKEGRINKAGYNGEPTTKKPKIDPPGQRSVKK